MNDLRIILRETYTPTINKNREFIVFNYTKNVIEVVNEADCTYLLRLNSIYKIDNLCDMINKNNNYSIMNSLSLLYKKAIDYIVINKCITDNKELSHLLNKLDHKLNYFLVFKVEYDDFIEIFQSKLNEITQNKKLTKKGE